ncbi:MAG: DUF433 domain-containing protein [Dehalococcoidia bacterium]
MTMTIDALPTPLRVDEDGVVRVGGTRVTLDTVAYAYLGSASPEEIVDRYPALSLADVYGAISYYLHHRAQIDRYLRERERQAAAVRRQNEERFDPHGVRQQLLSRRTARDT